MMMSGKDFLKYSSLCDCNHGTCLNVKDGLTWIDRRTGRRTDGRSTYCGITALCAASIRAVIKLQCVTEDNVNFVYFLRATAYML